MKRRYAQTCALIRAGSLRPTAVWRYRVADRDPGARRRGVSAARRPAELGAVVVDVCNAEGTLTDQDGLDVEQLRAQRVDKGANHTASPEAREMMQDRGMNVVPDWYRERRRRSGGRSRTGRTTFDTALTLTLAQDWVREARGWRDQLRGDVVTVR